MLMGKSYILSGKIVKVEDNYAILSDKNGSKYRIYFTDKMAPLFYLNKNMAVTCRTCKATKHRIAYHTHDPQIVARLKKNASSRAKAMAENRQLTEERQKNTIKASSNYNGSMPAVRGKKRNPNKKEVKLIKIEFDRGESKYIKPQPKLSSEELKRVELLELHESKLAYKKWKESLCAPQS